MMWWRKKKVKLQLTEDEMARVVRRRMLEPARVLEIEVNAAASVRIITKTEDGRETFASKWTELMPGDTLRLRGYDIYPTSQP